MTEPWLGSNKEGLAIVRVSSYKQEGGVSHETQETEIREYCAKVGIELVEIVRIIESAKDSELRKKYSRAVTRAIENNIRHLLFYMHDRETRNLTDVETNEKLVLADILVIHYVREQKVLHKGSPDSEFLIRDVQAAMNKHFIRSLRAKVTDAMRQKALNGWFPSNKVPLGYKIERIKDERGRELKRGSIVVKDSNQDNINWVLREFELRAQGMSFDEIKNICIEEGRVPPSLIKGYRKGTVEQRLKNPFYRGQFIWRGETFDGKHELFVPLEYLEAVQKTPGKGRPLPRDIEHGVFGYGWMRCFQCGCVITYEPKTRQYKSGGQRTWHYYRCANGKFAHSSLAGLYVPEEVIWSGFDQAVESITLPEKLADEIAQALNVSQKQHMAQAKSRIAQLQQTIKSFEAKEDRAYEDFVSGILDVEAFKRMKDKIRADRNRVQASLRASESELSGSFGETVNSVLELSKRAKKLYLSRPARERRLFLEMILSNPSLDGVTVRYQMKKPFEVLAKMGKNGEWCTQLDDIRAALATYRQEILR